MSNTMMRACGMSEEQIDRHELLVRAGFRVREVKGGYDLINDEREVHRGAERFNANSQFHRCAVEPVPSEAP